MPKVPRYVLKTYFERGDKPTEFQFQALIDSLVHYSDDRFLFGLRAYDENVEYMTGDSVIFNNGIYTALTGTTGPFNPFDWQQLQALGSMVFVGTWNASTNTPTLVSGVGTAGHYYVVSDAGSTTLDGISSWVAGDWAVFDGNVWQRVASSANDSDDQSAIEVPFLPNGDITSNNVQNAIVEVRDDANTKLAAKADKVSGATLGHFAGLNSNGNLTDSNYAPHDFLYKANTDPFTPTGDYNPATKKYADDAAQGKADKVSPATNGHFAGLNASGNLVDSGFSASSFVSSSTGAASMVFTPGCDLTATTVQAAIIQLCDNTNSRLGNKADKASNPVSGHFASLTAQGNLSDSGFSATSFLASTSTALNIPFADATGGDIVATNVQGAIRELRDDTNTKLTLKVDKVPTAVAGHIATFNSSGGIVDSNLTSSSFLLASDGAAGISFAAACDLPAGNVQSTLVELCNRVNAKLDGGGVTAQEGDFPMFDSTGGITNSFYNPNSFVLAADGAAGISFNAACNLPDGNVQDTIALLCTEVYAKLSRRPERVLPFTNGHLVVWDLDGNVADSGYAISDLNASGDAININFEPFGNYASTNVQDAFIETDGFLNGKIDKVPAATDGRFPKFSGGGIVDSGFSASSFIAAGTGASGIGFTASGDISSTNVQSAIVELRDDTDIKLGTKADKVSGAINGHFAGLNASGNLIDSGFSSSSFLSSSTTAANITFADGTGGDISSTNVQGAIREVRDDTDIKLGGKLNRISNPVAGNFAALSADGTLVDSTFRSTSFIAAGTGASGIAFTANGDITSTNVQSAIVEVRDDTDTKLTNKITKVSSPTAGNFPKLGSTGDLSDSGFSSSSFMAANTAASGIGFTASGDITSTNVQSAIVEVRDDTDTKLSSKADKVSGATNGRFAGLNASGNLTDSGFSSSSFLAAGTGASGISFTANGDIASTNVQAAIVEVRDDTDTKLNGKIPTVPGAVNGRIAVFASGRIADGGKSLSDYLSTTNTAAYTPTSTYHPATKDYVDQAVAGVGGGGSSSGASFIMPIFVPDPYVFSSPDRCIVPGQITLPKRDVVSGNSSVINAVITVDYKSSEPGINLIVGLVDYTDYTMGQVNFWPGSDFTVGDTGGTWKIGFNGSAFQIDPERSYCIGFQYQGNSDANMSVKGISVTLRFE